MLKEDKTEKNIKHIEHTEYGLDREHFKMLQNGKTIFTDHLFVLPVHVGGCHWGVLYVDYREKKFTYYDSLGWSGDEPIKV